MTLRTEILSADDALGDAVLRALDDVMDPEIPVVSIRDLGMVHAVRVESGFAHVQLLPTFVGCPALEFIAVHVRKRLEGIEGLVGLDVSFVMTTPWTSERISSEGIEKLRTYGIAAPVDRHKGNVVPPCPYCGTVDTDIENLFGPTACRSIYYCNQCRQPFEGMKRL